MDELERAREWLGRSGILPEGLKITQDLAALLRRERAEALREAARECEEHAVLNDAVEGGAKCADPHTGFWGSAPEHRAIEARECAAAIKAKIESVE